MSSILAERRANVCVGFFFLTLPVASLRENLPQKALYVFLLSMAVVSAPFVSVS
ncbi:hypothetical protein ACU8KH_03600 [Lachancea thermotolerans]